MLKYTAEQIDILEAQYNCSETTYHLMMKNIPWAVKLWNDLPPNIGDKWNSMTNNVFDWAETASIDEIKILVEQLSTLNGNNYVRGKLKWDYLKEK